LSLTCDILVSTFFSCKCNLYRYTAFARALMEQEEEVNSDDEDDDVDTGEESEYGSVAGSFAAHSLQRSSLEAGRGGTPGGSDGMSTAGDAAGGGRTLTPPDP
jgi:hypothetical protein